MTARRLDSRVREAFAAMVKAVGCDLTIEELERLAIEECRSRGMTQPQTGDALGLATSTVCRKQAKWREFDESSGDPAGMVPGPATPLGGEPAVVADMQVALPET